MEYGDSFSTHRSETQRLKSHSGQGYALFTEDGATMSSQNVPLLLLLFLS
jgi:hypothetical protein